MQQSANLSREKVNEMSDAYKEHYKETKAMFADIQAKENMNRKIAKHMNVHKLYIL